MKAETYQRDVLLRNMSGQKQLTNSFEEDNVFRAYNQLFWTKMKIIFLHHKKDTHKDLRCLFLAVGKYKTNWILIFVRPVWEWHLSIFSEKLSVFTFDQKKFILPTYKCRQNMQWKQSFNDLNSFHLAVYMVGWFMWNSAAEILVGPVAVSGKSSDSAFVVFYFE